MGERRTLKMPVDVEAQFKEIFALLQVQGPEYLLETSLRDLLAEMFWAGWNRGASQRAREERFKERALARVSSAEGEYVRVTEGTVVVGGYEVGHYTPDEQVDAIPYTRVQPAARP